VVPPLPFSTISENRLYRLDYNTTRDLVPPAQFFCFATKYGFSVGPLRCLASPLIPLTLLLLHKGIQGAVPLGRKVATPQIPFSSGEHRRQRVLQVPNPPPSNVLPRFPLRTQCPLPSPGVGRLSGDPLWVSGSVTFRPYAKCG